jgi:hypothetical protein
MEKDRTGEVWVYCGPANLTGYYKFITILGPNKFQGDNGPTHNDFPQTPPFSWSFLTNGYFKLNELHLVNQILSKYE